LEIALYILALQWFCCAETCNQRLKKEGERGEEKIWLAAVGIVACLLLQIPAKQPVLHFLDRHCQFGRRRAHGRCCVSAKRVGGRVTVSVVSDQKGRYAFPADRLAAGEYEIRIRAIEYDAANPNMTASVKKEKATRADIKLNKIQILPFSSVPRNGL